MNEQLFRIFKHTYYDHGTVRSTFYTVKRKSKFLFWEFWRPLYRSYHDGNDEARFDTEGEAVIAIKRFQMGVPIMGWTEELIQEIDTTKKVNE